MRRRPPKKIPKPKKRGRPTLFTPAIKKTLLFLAMKGCTDDEMAKIIRVTTPTLNNWKNAHPDFFDALKSNKLLADTEVERSLFERACGYSHEAVHISSYLGVITKTKIIKQYAPDPLCMIFWLKNRQPNNWKDRIEKINNLEPIILNMNFGSKSGN